MTSFEYFQFQLVVGLVAGTLFGTYAYLIDRFLSRIYSLGETILISSLGYILVIIIMVLIVFTMLTTFIDTSLNQGDFQKFLSDGHPVVIMVYCFIVGFLIEFVQQLDLKFGPGNLWKMLKGTYYRPIEEERVLMFLDMRSSTMSWLLWCREQGKRRMSVDIIYIIAAKEKTLYN